MTIYAYFPTEGILKAEGVWMMICLYKYLLINHSPTHNYETFCPKLIANIITKHIIIPSDLTLMEPQTPNGQARQRDVETALQNIMCKNQFSLKVVREY